MAIQKIISNILILILKGYRVFLSPLKPYIFGPGCGCRFSPSCSEYAIIALKKHRVCLALYLIAKRLIACNPFNDCDKEY
ncbi:MAG: membrane protein insertion efficiency factor YidD [Puniceicoccales bacterium]|nr:membrane protein insertion efficiency factor YidD [Puniceicoccales bacterium]